MFYAMTAHRQDVRSQATAARSKATAMWGLRQSGYPAVKSEILKHVGHRAELGNSLSEYAAKHGRTIFEGEK